MESNKKMIIAAACMVVTFSVLVFVSERHIGNGGNGRANDNETEYVDSDSQNDVEEQESSQYEQSKDDKDAKIAELESKIAQLEQENSNRSNSNDESYEEETQDVYRNTDSGSEQFVDLGLSVKWATCNVGANSPEEFGEYYTFDDAQELNGFGKRVPTYKELEELVNNCDWTWTTKNGVNGYKVTSKKNGNSIFLPAAGRHDGTGVDRVGSYGYYWSSSASYIGDDGAECLYFYSNEVGLYDYRDRNFGQSVRLVQEVKEKFIF